MSSRFTTTNVKRRPISSKKFPTGRDARPTVVVTTDVNGTITGENTFGELLRRYGRFEQMQALMDRYTTGACGFRDVLPQMQALAEVVARQDLEAYATRMPLYQGVTAVLGTLVQSRNLEATIALCTTGFAGLMALVNRYRFDSQLLVAASPVLVEKLNPEEKACLIRSIVDEQTKAQVLDDLVGRDGARRGTVFHVGDTLGDLHGIRRAAEVGGVGIAFRPNTALKAAVSRLPQELRRRVAVIEFAPGVAVDFAKVGDVIRQTLWEATGVEV